MDEASAKGPTKESAGTLIACAKIARVYRYAIAEPTTPLIPFARCERLEGIVELQR